MSKYMSVLVLGANGFIGKNMVDALSRNGYSVHAVDKAIQKQDNEKIKTAAISLMDTQKIKKYIVDNEIEMVVHLVSSLLPSSSYTDYLNELNDVIIPTFELIEFFSEKNIKLVYFSSGGAVYGNIKDEVINEKVICCPTNFYGYSKLVIEEYIKMRCYNKQLQYLIIRPSNPYGKHQNPNGNQGFIAVAMGKLINQQVINIWGDGSVVRDYIYIEDLCNACMDLINKDVINETFNIGTGVGYSLNEVISVLNNVTNKHISVNYQDARNVDLKKTILDISKLKLYISFTPCSLNEGMRNYYEWLHI